MRFPILSYNFNTRIILLNFGVILILLEILNIFRKVEGNEEIVVKKLLCNKKLLEDVMISEDII